MSEPSQQPTIRPDLDENINVTSAHSAPPTSAAARENPHSGYTRESLSIAVFIVCSVILIIAGSVIGKAQGSLFGYKTTMRPDYVRGKAPGVVDDTELPPKPILAAYMKKGASLYTKCSGCHMSDGKGNGSTVPPLAGSEWVVGYTQRLSQVILNGLGGPMSTGTTWGIMNAQRAGMSPLDLACVMTYIRNSFGNATGDVVTPEQAKAAFDIADARKDPNAPVSALELKEHEKALPGEIIDPTTLVDPVTLMIKAK